MIARRNNQLQTHNTAQANHNQWKAPLSSLAHLDELDRLERLLAGPPRAENLTDAEISGGPLSQFTRPEKIDIYFSVSKGSHNDIIFRKI